MLATVTIMAASAFPTNEQTSSAKKNEARGERNRRSASCRDTEPVVCFQRILILAGKTACREQVYLCRVQGVSIQGGLLSFSAQPDSTMELC